MSYIESSSIASCIVAEDFDLNEYLKSLVDFIGNHFEDLDKDLQNSLGDLTYDETLEELGYYIRLSDGKNLLIEMNTEYSNNQCHIWDWLCDQVRQDAMTSLVMELKYSSNSKHGMESSTSYYLKDGTFIGADDVFGIIEEYAKTKVTV